MLITQATRGDEVFVLAHGALAVYFDASLGEHGLTSRDTTAPRPPSPVTSRRPAHPEKVRNSRIPPLGDSGRDEPRIDQVSAAEGGAGSPSAQDGTSSSSIKPGEIKLSRSPSGQLSRTKTLSGKLFGSAAPPSVTPPSGAVAPPSTREPEADWSCYVPISDHKIGEVRGGRLDSLVGEVALFPETAASTHLRTCTVVARSHCELYAISRLDFHELCAQYPAARSRFVALAKERRKRTDELRRSWEHENRIATLRGAVSAAASEETAAKMLQSIIRGQKSRSVFATIRQERGEQSVNTRMQALEDGQARLEKKIELVLAKLTHEPKSPTSARAANGAGTSLAL